MKKLFRFDLETKGHLSKIKKVALSYAKTTDEVVLFTGLFTFPIYDWYNNPIEITHTSVHLIFNTPYGRYKLSLYEDGYSAYYAM